MGTSFKQSRLALRLEAEILDQGVRFVEKDILRSYERVIPFTEIIDSKVTFFNVNRLYIVISVGLISLFILRCHGYWFEGDVTLGQVLWSGFWALAAALGTWMRSVRYIGFHATGGGIFFFDRQGRGDPRPFLKQIVDARQVYLEKLYRSNTFPLEETDPLDRWNLSPDNGSLN